MTEWGGVGGGVGRVEWGRVGDGVGWGKGRGGNRVGVYYQSTLVTSS